MEVVERERVPEKRDRESRLERRTRLRGGFRQSRLYGVRRIPRSLAGGVLGMVVLFLFWAGIAGYTLHFFIGLAIVVGFVALVVWALVQTPIRPTFDQRWHPKRRIEPLDTAPWRELAERLGATLSLKRGLPAVVGAMDGIAFRLFFKRRGGAGTVALATLPFPVRSRFKAFRRLADFKTREDIDTGDVEFDAAWHVTCADRTAAGKLLSPEARRWIAATAPDEVGARGRVAAARVTGFTSDPDLLFGLVKTVVEMAKG